MLITINGNDVNRISITFFFTASIRFILINKIAHIKMDKGNNPTTPFDKKAKQIENPASKRCIILLCFMFFIKKRIDKLINIFMVFSNILLEQDQKFNGIVIQSSIGIQLKLWYSFLEISFHIK